MRLRLHTFCLDVQKEGDRVTGIVIGGKSGMWLITGKVFVDAPGDADLCFRAGAPFQPAGEDGPAQSLTTTFRLGNVDEERALKVKRADLVRMIKEANLSGEYRLPCEEGSVHRTPLGGVVATNMTRVAYVDGTDPVELTKAEVEGRKQAMEYVRFLRERIPGYEQAYLINFSTQIGIRETRRVYGDCAAEGACRALRHCRRRAGGDLRRHKRRTRAVGGGGFDATGCGGDRRETSRSSLGAAGWRLQRGGRQWPAPRQRSSRALHRRRVALDARPQPDQRLSGLQICDAGATVTVRRSVVD